MCGRYVIVSSVETMEQRFGVKAAKPKTFIPNTNLSPGDVAPVISNSDPGALQFFTFGFSPSWADKRRYLLNARSEGDLNPDNDPAYRGEAGILNKPMFRKAIRSQRCLVPADAFIEGPEKEKLSKPFVVHLRKKQRPFAMAGIWDLWQDPKSGEVHAGFAILTTTANAVLQAIGHHRSPVILAPEDEEAWLDPHLPMEALPRLLRPYPAEQMNAYPVDPAIKNPKVNGLALLEPIGPPVMGE